MLEAFVLGGAIGSGLTGLGLLIPIREKERREAAEIQKSSERFTDRISGYLRQYGELKRDEIVFVDERGKPLGNPIKLEDIGGIPPGKLDETGLLVDEVINQDWLDAQRLRICDARPGLACDIRGAIPQQLNVIQAIREAIQKTEGETIDPETFMDIVSHYGKKEVILGKGLNRIEYIQEQSMSTNLLPEGFPADARREVRRLLPALAAQESRYNNKSRSRKDARGIFQFTEGAWEDFGGGEDILFLKNQVPAVTRYMGNAYEMMQEKAAESLAKVKDEFFGGDEERFNIYFLVPALLNSYNAGPKRMVAVVNWFVEQCSTREKFTEYFGRYADEYGYDVFFAMVSAAKGQSNVRYLDLYGKDASEYVPRIYALAVLLKKEGLTK